MSDVQNDQEYTEADFDAETEAAAAAAVEAEGSSEAETVVKNGEDVTPKRTRIAPKYELGFVGGGLPEDEKAPRKIRKGGGGGGRGRLADQFVKLLNPIVADEDLHGEWLVAAEYATAVGAKGAMKAILADERVLPKGAWEFETRRFMQPILDDEGNQPIDEATGQPAVRPSSRLFVRFHGDVSVDEIATTDEAPVNVEQVYVSDGTKAAEIEAAQASDEATAAE